jgi:hypothetical protein
MHLLKINTSDQPKIVIKSPEVYLGITRQHAQVGHKNIPKNWIQRIHGF